jgi:hypothetical protein
MISLAAFRSYNIKNEGKKIEESVCYLFPLFGSDPSLLLPLLPLLLPIDLEVIIKQDSVRLVLLCIMLFVHRCCCCLCIVVEHLTPNVNDSINIIVVSIVLLRPYIRTQKHINTCTCICIYLDKQACNLNIQTNDL